MEGLNHNNNMSLERVVSQRALLMSTSFPCQVCVIGFLSGICLTSLFLAAFTSFGITASFSQFSSSNSGSSISMDTGKL